MKIALCSSFVPFIQGGARNIVDWLAINLQAEGHEVEKIYLPQVDNLHSLSQQMMAYRWIDLDVADRVICFRPQAHLISHPHKIIWFIHHIRIFYDLWDSPYRGFPDNFENRGIRDALFSIDNHGLREAKSIFTNSRVVSERLKKYNDIDSDILYPPVFQPERFYSQGFNNEIVYICRLEHHKRQHLLIEAMKYVKSPVCLRLAGASSRNIYCNEINLKIKRWQLQDRVILDNRWISEQEKIDLLANCLAAAYIPFDEDSYGYPSIEASHAKKPILTTSDSGGVLELVQNDINGYVADPYPEALAERIDQLYIDKSKTITMGKNAATRLVEMNISWSNVLEKLLT
jgi:glycosyltransferase involved in cell wall biosynthesis